MPPLEIVPLGGLGEFGMNMMVIACGESAILVDAGVMFPEPELLGVDLVIPDLRAGFSHLIAALAAEGTSTVYGVNLINRGYEDFEAKLAALGAHIERP